MKTRTITSSILRGNLSAVFPSCVTRREVILPTVGGSDPSCEVILSTVGGSDPACEVILSTVGGGDPSCEVILSTVSGGNPASEVILSTVGGGNPPSEICVLQSIASMKCGRCPAGTVLRLINPTLIEHCGNVAF